MRELIVISGLIFLGYLAESSARFVMSESCRIYVETVHAASASGPNCTPVTVQSKPAAIKGKNSKSVELTASNSQNELTVRRQ